MPIRKFLQSSILNRLKLATAMLVISFVLIAVVLLGTYLQVHDDIGQVVQTQLQQTVENSRASRVLAQFFARQSSLEMTAFGQTDYLQTEGAELQQLLQQLQQGVSGKELREALLPLQLTFAGYLQQYRSVNELVGRRHNLDEAINLALLFMEEILAEKMIEAASQGESTDYFERLTMQLFGYRARLSEITMLNLGNAHQRLRSNSFVDPPPLPAVLDTLRLRLRTLILSAAPLDRLARHLLSQIEYCQHLMLRYHQEMIYLGQQMSELNQVADQLLAEMGKVDQQSSVVAQQVSEGVAQKVQVAGLIVLSLLVALAIALGLAHRNLFRKHIQQPLETIRQRLLRFQGGDYRSPLPLDREDEWGQIEEAFNQVLAGQLKSWSALQESERRYRNIFENASEGIFQSSLQGRLLNINPAMANILGYDSAEEALAVYTDLSTQLYVQPGFRKQLVDRLRVKGSIRSVEVRMRRRNGEIFWASLNGHLIKDEQGNELLVEGTLEDISTRRAAEESLRQLQRHLQNIIDSMPSILIGIDVNCQVTLWNKQAEQLCEIPSFEAKGRPLQQVFSLLAADSYLPQVMETLSNREPQRLEKLISETQGRQRYFNLLIYPLATTEASGAVIHIDEVTERVKMDEMIVQSEKMLSVGGLAAGMAHEINNPLAVILQNAQVLGQRLSPSLDKNRRTAEALGFGLEQLDEYVGQRGIKQMLQSITESGQRAAKIVENMLSFSRKSSSSLIPQSLADLVEQALVLAASDYDLKHKFDFRNISIVRDFAQVPAVPCEASQIQQVILNLLKNAAYVLGLKAVNPQIVLRIFQQDQMICLQVEDNGPGIDLETRKRIFEPFYTTKEVGSGTGLGLSVAYFIITENHRGRLTVASDDGEGSCFTLELPLPSNAAEARRFEGRSRLARISVIEGLTGGIYGCYFLEGLLRNQNRRAGQGASTAGGPDQSSLSGDS